MGYATHPSTTQILDLGINRRRVTEVFELPTKTQLNLKRYSDEPSDDEILEFLRFIGEIKNAVIAKQEDQARGTEPKNLVFHRFFAILLGDALIGEGKLPTEGKMIKVYDMKSHKPTVLKSGYPGARPLPARILAYLNSEDGVKTYIHGHRTPEPSEGAAVRTEEAEGAEVRTEAVVEKREKKLKKKRTPKKRVAEEEAPKSPTEVAKPKKKAKKLTKAATSELVPSPDVSEPAESEQPPQSRRRKAQVIESSEERPSSPLRVAMAIAEEVQKLHSGTLGEFADFTVQDVTGLSSSDDEGNKISEEIGEKDALGTPPKPTPSATHTSTPAVLVQRGIETGPHSPNPAQAIRTEDIPSSSIPPFGETKPTSLSQKGESVALRVHSPQDTSLPHTEVFVTSVTHKSDAQTTSDLVVKEHDDSVALEQPQDPFNISLKGVSEPSPKERVDRTSIGASSVEHRGLEGNPSELNIPTGSMGAKNSLAKSGTCVVPEVTSDTFVTKGEFKAFADMVLTKLDELKSSSSKHRRLDCSSSILNSTFGGDQ
ncbi:hypothetical protein L6452_06385 [Arctium lappa]|uniref:Uncharacterized protein n=1 Tax=Arctium lappa TaxID=4217 RepID=A0ACB9EIE4_ARCLA|nr:hypothetical protein L6452_06385 [Arctium lappa]